MNISVFGLGYVGCVSLGCLAKNGHQVTGVDINADKVQLINSGFPTIIEKDIDKLIAEQHKRGAVSATLNHAEAVKNSDVAIICVGTPSTSTGHLDMSYVYRTAEQIAKGLKGRDRFFVIAVRSTVAPGTCRKITEIISENSGLQANKDFAVAANPEFLREGSAVDDYFHPAVTVIGTDHPRAAEILTGMYKEIDAPVRVVGYEIAELIKYINNSYHALKITFANEVGNLCRSMGIDSHQLMDLFLMDNRLNISPAYFKPGFAYGGSCLPKDLKALNTLAHDYYLELPVIGSIEKSNTLQKNIAYNMIEKSGKKKIAILGLSFKTGTDDLRYSPVVEIIEKLLGKGFVVKIYDEYVRNATLTGSNKEFAEKHLPHVFMHHEGSLTEVVEWAEVVVITHREPEYAELIEKYPQKQFIDLVRVYSGRSGGNYAGICW